MAYIPTEPYVFDSLTAMEHVNLCIDLWEMNGHEATYISLFHFLCHELNTDGYLNKKINECSYGTRYKLYLAMMLAREPKLIFLDEPFTSMDQKSKNSIIKYLQKIMPNVIIIFTSHQQDIVHELSTAQYSIENKSIILH